MKALAIALFFCFSFSWIELHAESYQDCILKNMKDVHDREAVLSIKASCRYKATPIKCRKYTDKYNPDYDPLSERFNPLEKLGIKDPYKECLKECVNVLMNANFFERELGDCSTH